MTAEKFGPSESEMGLSEKDKQIGHESEIGSAEFIDAKWYKRYEAVASFDAWAYLSGDKKYRDGQKQQFIDGQIENPVLDYPLIDKDRLVKDEEGLLMLKKDVIEQEPNEVIRQLYRWKINEKIAEVGMLRSVANGDMRRFKRYSEFIYGKPSPEIFAYTVANLKNIAGQHLNSENTDIKKAAEELNEALSFDLPRAQIMDLPNEKNFELVSKKTMPEISSLYNIQAGEEGKQYTADEIRAIFEDVLKGLKAEGWGVEMDLRRTGMSVSQEHKKVNVPESMKQPLKTLQMLIVHEIGTHVARRIKGERSKLRLLGLGLDRYEKGEEGIATMREQVVKGSVDDFAGLLGHLAISLAYGLDGKKRNFRQVYEIMVKHAYFKGLLTGKKPEEAKLAASTSAWITTLRAFNGTKCITPGVCFTKDIIYREGNMGVWNVVKEKPEELDRFSVGKYNPANQRHIWILDQLGITDADLEKVK